jgi:hypothetical protein
LPVRPPILRHDPGLAASPPACYMLEVARGDISLLLLCRPQKRRHCHEPVARPSKRLRPVGSQDDNGRRIRGCPPAGTAAMDVGPPGRPMLAAPRRHRLRQHLVAPPLGRSRARWPAAGRAGPGRWHLSPRRPVRDRHRGFYCAIGEAINGPAGYFGWDLDALDDCLCGRFGAQASFRLVWHHSSVAREHLLSGYDRRRLGPAVTLEYLLGMLAKRHVEVVLR